MLSQKNIDEFKSRLEKERAKLLGELKNDETPQDLDSDSNIDEEAESDEAEELTNQLALAQSHRDRINAIDAALNKIRGGSYGKCENCGQDIPLEVLNLVPESKYCENCKREMK